MQPAKCRILCVDDHEDTSFMLAHLLKRENVEVVTARSMAEALMRCQSEKFDLYVLDKRLPDGSGLDLCAQLNAATPHVPIIFYTGDGYELHRQEGMCVGADAYVVKPDVDGLIETVQMMLADKECVTGVTA